MMTAANRWIVIVGWMTAMTFLWAIFVPGHLSNIAFAFIAVGGLFVTLCGVGLLNDSQAPRSVGAILADLESDDRRAPGSPTGASRRRP